MITFLLGCSDELVINNYYEDPVNFEFALECGLYYVSCDRTRSGDPRERAQQAAVNYESGVDAAAQRLYDQYGVAPEQSPELQRAVDAEVEAIINDNERRFGCFVLPRL